MRRVYTFFGHRNGWECQFLEAALKTPLTSDKVSEFARRGGAFKNLESEQGFDHGVQFGRGGVYLELTEEQYTPWPVSFSAQARAVFRPLCTRTQSLCIL
jgi:hypothetical protein